MRFLLVEDEKIMAKNIAFLLRREGYEVDITYDGEEALKLFARNEYDLILLDWTLPKKDGLQVCKQIRAESNIPIIMITAKGEIYDKVIGLELGADDYLVKPFDQRELIARIHVLLRRREQVKQLKVVKQGESSSPESMIQFEDIVLDRERLLLLYKENTMALTNNEYKLMELFIKKPYNVFSREYLYEEVWGGELMYNERTVDITISRLRKKILELSGKKYFQSIRGMGYSLGERI